MGVRMSSDESASGRGSQGLKISNGIVRLMHDATGRGPNKARTEMGRDLIAVVLGDTLTKAERTLVEHGRTEEVLTARRAMQEVIGPEACQLVEEVSGRKVLAFMSENHIDPDLSVELFVLEPVAEIAERRENSTPS